MSSDDKPVMGGLGGLNRVKNKAPAPVQITAEQLLREAWENKEEVGSAIVGPRYTIADAEELAEYQQTTRKRFEDRIVRARSNISLWLRYARWEEAQRDFTRARSVFERAIDMDYRAPGIWLAYAEMEMRHRFVNHARNVWDRAVTYLPRLEQLWLKYAFMEEMLENVELARLVFTRWLKWLPDLSAYVAFVQFELRHGSIPRARGVYEVMVSAHTTLQSYLKYAAFEEKHDNIPAARAIFERAGEVRGISTNSEFYIAFGKFEERCAEADRARAIYNYAISNLPEVSSAPVHDALMSFEKQRGERLGIEAVVLGKKRVDYEKRLLENPRDYDVWFDLIRLEDSAAASPEDVERVRQTYERAVANTPPVSDKRFWRRYIYLWIEYAIWEELSRNDQDRAARVYKACLAAIPENHRRFSFGKVWVLAAKLEIRRRNVTAARRLLGNALGVHPHKDALYREYIALELSLADIDRARMLYKQWLMRNPAATAAYVEFADMEVGLGELERARAIFEMGMSATELDAPEVLWKAYIDFAIAAGEIEKVIELYERLIAMAGHVRLWLSYAKYMQTCGELEARGVYEKGSRALKERVVEHGNDSDAARADRVKLLDAWLVWEQSLARPDCDDQSFVERVVAIMPKRIKRRRPVKDARDVDAGWEEYYEYTFPEEQAAKPQLKLLEAARKWALQKEQEAATTAGKP
jgi:crooked neck